MKICTNCKAASDDNAKFCQYCGSSSFEQTSQQQGSQNPQEEFVQQNQQGFSQQTFDSQQPAMNPAITAIKSLGSSSLFLTAVILFTVFAFFAFVNYSISSTVGDLAQDIAKQLGTRNDVFLNIADIAASYKNYNMANVLLLGIPNILICIALWLIRKSCKSSVNNVFDIKAFRFLKILLIIIFITSILSLLVLGGFLSEVVRNIEFTDDFLNDFSSYKLNNLNIDIVESVKNTIIGIFMFGIAIAITLKSIYYAKILRTFKSISNTVASGVASDYISMFVVVNELYLRIFLFIWYV
jgi:hypothetical protein